MLTNLDLSKAETQALTNYGSGEDENEDEEVEEFEEGPVDVQTSLQANTETAEENERGDQVSNIDQQPPSCLILTTKSRSFLTMSKFTASPFSFS